jgi:hypothetical protein
VLLVPRGVRRRGLEGATTAELHAAAEAGDEQIVAAPPPDANDLVRYG